MAEHLASMHKTLALICTTANKNYTFDFSDLGFSGLQVQVIELSNLYLCLKILESHLYLTNLLLPQLSQFWVMATPRPNSQVKNFTSSLTFHCSSTSHPTYQQMPTGFLFLVSMLLQGVCPTGFLNPCRVLPISVCHQKVPMTKIPYLHPKSLLTGLAVNRAVMDPFKTQVRSQLSLVKPSNSPPISFKKKPKSFQ